MGLYKRILSDFKQLFLGYETLVIIPQSCLGGAVAALILMNSAQGTWQFVELFLAVAVAMWYNTTVLADMKPRFVFNSLLISLGVNLVLLIVNLFELIG